MATLNYILLMMLRSCVWITAKCQIVGMSATLSNMEDLKKFMGADLFHSDFRPIRLREFIKVGGTVEEINRPGTPVSESPFQFFQHVRNIPSQGVKPNAEARRGPPTGGGRLVAGLLVAK